MAVVAASSTSMLDILNPIDTAKHGDSTSVSLKHFLDIAMKVAQIDEAIVSARASAPSREDVEAFKWHEVSIKALMWTRSSLVDQQSNALGQLKNSVISQSTSGLSSKLPVPKEAKMSSLSVAAPVFSPAAQMKPTKPPTPSQVGAKVAAGEMTVGSLRDDLERLKEYDAQQCLIVRRIKRLGLGSPEILRQHFASFGEVREMLISHSFEKKSAKCRADRVRPAALGFVVMGTVDSAQAVLRAGPTVMVGDVDVEVKSFEPTEALQQQDSVETQPRGLKNFQ